MKQFKLPDVGEGLTEAEIVSWKVKPGDVVAVNDVVVEIETAKSLVELPSPYAGVVEALLVPEGTTVDVGTPIISVDDGSTSTPPAEEGTIEAGLIGGAAPGGRTSVLVGYGPRTTSAVRRARKGATPTGVSAATAQQAVQTSMMTAPTPVPEPALADAADALPAADVPTPGADPAARVLAKPPVRKLAKDLGVDLTALAPSGAGGVVTRADVEAAATLDGSGSAEGPQRSRTEHVGRETRLAVKGVRKMTAAAMVASAFTAPHVTEWVTVDVTATMTLVEKLRADREFRDLKVSPLLLLAKALLLAVRRNPGINAAWEETADGTPEIVVKHYVNLGIAAATPRGLVVPNIKDADQLSLRELAEAMGVLTATAREGRTQPAEMSGGTITITNVGVFGIDSGTPIINPGEAAILCFGAVRDMPWVFDGAIAVRKVTQLALSFDHRLVDGALGSMFLADIARVLEDPATALLW